MARIFGKSASDAPLEDPTALARFGRLEVVARLIVEGYMIGQHKSPFKGASVEFTEHRQYYPGDEIRHIDWRAFGKTGKYYIKEFEDETNLRCYLLVDGSGSMSYGESTLSKFDYTRQLAAALGYLLLTQRDGVGLITFDTKVRDQVPASTNAKTFQRIVSILQKYESGAETSLSGVIEQILPTMKRRALVVIISDFFADFTSLMNALKRFRHSHHEVILFQVVAPEEREFPFRNPTQFRNLERNRHRRLVDPHRLRAHYLESFQNFCKDLETSSGNIGIDYQMLVTSEPYHKALGAYLDARTRQKSKR